jgi:hypothetical protein
VSSHPDGTKAWRKGWRKRWREGSSFRALSPLARMLLIWIEDNADDEGMAGPTTERWLAGLMSCPSEKVSRDAIHRAASALIRAGLVSKRPHLDPHHKPRLAPTVYVRANWKEYQGAKEEPHLDPHLENRDTRTYLAEEGRGKQKKQKTTAPEAPLPPGTQWQELLEAMCREWGLLYTGKKLVLLGKDFKPLRALVVSLTDDEVYRRWQIYLTNSDPFYTGHPVSLFCSQVNRFVVAPAREASFQEPWETTRRSAPWQNPEDVPFDA